MNYFNYFTEIEERFQQRRSSLLMLSTLDWALIETWREAGIPLEAVLRGIDTAFDHAAAPGHEGIDPPMRAAHHVTGFHRGVGRAGGDIREGLEPTILDKERVF